VIVIIFFVGLIAGRFTFSKEKQLLEENNKVILKEPRKIEINLLAVDDTGKGVTPKLITQIRPGTGLVLVNINNVLAEVDAQYSARLAKKVAESVSGINLNETDVIFDILTSANFIGGQSAGGAMALSLISLIENKEINQSVMITGAIDENGTIHEVGEVYKKSVAAKKAGGLTVLVPLNESSNLVEYNKIRKCTQMPEGKFGDVYAGKKYCQTRFEGRKVNLGEEIGIDVIEVKDVKEAMIYYFI